MQWEECSGRSDAAGIRFGWASFFHFQVDLYRVSLSLADAGTEEPGPRASVWRRAEGQNASCRSHAREMSGVRLAFVRIAVRDRARARGTATAGVTRGADASFVACLQLTDTATPRHRAASNVAGPRARGRSKCAESGSGRVRGADGAGGGGH